MINDKKHLRNGYGGTSFSSNGVSGLFNDIKSSFKLFASSNTPKKSTRLRLALLLRRLMICSLQI